jgi:hypothetical protein
MYLGPHVGAQSRCACPPSAIKGEACDVRHTRNLRLASSYKLSSNTTHSGVGYYAPAARTTLNPCVFLSSSPSLQRSSKTPKPLLILGFRAGALHHPAGDFLSDRFEHNNESTQEHKTRDLSRGLDLLSVEEPTKGRVFSNPNPLQDDHKGQGKLFFSNWLKIPGDINFLGSSTTLETLKQPQPIEELEGSKNNKFA